MSLLFAFWPVNSLFVITLWKDIAYAVAFIMGGTDGNRAIDNVLRPILVGRDTEMPDLIILISTLGGLAMFGAEGLIIGPVIAGLFIGKRDADTQLARIIARRPVGVIHSELHDNPLRSFCQRTAERLTAGMAILGLPGRRPIHLATQPYAAGLHHRLRHRKK